MYIYTFHSGPDVKEDIKQLESKAEPFSQLGQKLETKPATRFQGQMKNGSTMRSENIIELERPVKTRVEASRKQF